MALVLDTKVSGVSYILDNQAVGTFSTGTIFTTVGSASATGVTAVVTLPRSISCTPANASASGIVATLQGSVIITTVPAYANALGVTASVTGSVYLDYFTVKVRHKTTGAPITGLSSVNLTMYKPSTGHRLDFSDSTYKDTPSVSTSVMAELSALNHPGVYRLPVNISGWDGWVSWEATYNDGSYTYNYSGERYYASNNRVDKVPMSGNDISSTVWNYPASSITNTGTMGVWVLTRLLTVSKFLGLK